MTESTRGKFCLSLFYFYIHINLIYIAHFGGGGGGGREEGERWSFGLGWTMCIILFNLTWVGLEFVLEKLHLLHLCKMCFTAHMCTIHCAQFNVHTTQRALYHCILHNCTMCTTLCSEQFVHWSHCTALGAGHCVHWAVHAVHSLCKRSRFKVHNLKNLKIVYLHMGMETKSTFSGKLLYSFVQFCTRSIVHSTVRPVTIQPLNQSHSLQCLIIWAHYQKRNIKARKTLPSGPSGTGTKHSTSRNVKTYATASYSSQLLRTFLKSSIIWREKTRWVENFTFQRLWLSRYLFIFHLSILISERVS